MVELCVHLAEIQFPSASQYWKKRPHLILKSWRLSRRRGRASAEASFDNRTAPISAQQDGANISFIYRLLYSAEVKPKFLSPSKAIFLRLPGGTYLQCTLFNTNSAPKYFFFHTNTL